MFLDEFDKASGISRTCEQSVAVNKCEGACASSLRPSALNSNGFSKVKIISISDYCIEYNSLCLITIVEIKLNL